MNTALPALCPSTGRCVFVIPRRPFVLCVACMAEGAGQRGSTKIAWPLNLRWEGETGSLGAGARLGLRKTGPRLNPALPPT
ncbi:hypothetical protein E2C01_092341 [Portunus trituberculatus]|uniref:Uncharacterized protein n=1 Tax=Portunus trituberculatus TaxID=210409 RepID=A0A5B7JLI2_PORTR|nr:hypothetical protein [Portunus trituberculatus]